MRENVRQNVETSSPEFAEGVEAGLNSTKDTTNWQAGNELGQELKDEREKTSPVSDSPLEKPTDPLFMRHSSEGHEGTDQDEKDESEE
jgi:hypothetical protein